MIMTRLEFIGTGRLGLGLDNNYYDDNTRMTIMMMMMFRKRQIVTDVAGLIIFKNRQVLYTVSTEVMQ